MFLNVVGLIWFANAFDYPLIVGGKPMFSVPMTFVPAYIMMIMGGAVGALIGMFGLQRAAALASSAVHERTFCTGLARQILPADRLDRPEIFRNRNPQAARIHRRRAHRDHRGLMRYLLYFILVFVASAAALFAIIGIPGHLSRKPPLEVFPDMDRQAKLRPEKPFDFFTNGLSSQLPPAGTVVRSEPVETVNGAVYRISGRAVQHRSRHRHDEFCGDSIRCPWTPALLQRGREQFDIYCAPCHGRLGDGNGITKKIGVMPAVANLHDQRIVEMTDGEIFNTITHGKGLMGAYGPNVPAQDRWAIVAYARALQLSWLGSTNELSAAQRAALK